MRKSSAEARSIAAMPSLLGNRFARQARGYEYVVMSGSALRRDRIRDRLTALRLVAMVGSSVGDVFFLDAGSHGSAWFVRACEPCGGPDDCERRLRNAGWNAKSDVMSPWRSREASRRRASR